MDSIILQTGDNTVTDGDVIGRLGFAASSETGADARLVVAKIEAVAEEAFDADSNATELVFYLAAGDAAVSKMTLTSAGNLNIAGELQTANIGYTDGDNAMVIADGGKVTFAAGFAVGSDAAGDILYHNGTSYIRLGIGSDGQVLTVNDAADGVGWEAASGGGSGDITSVVAGAGLTGGATTGDATVNVIGGDGITANANDVAITAAQTTITSVVNAALVIGRDADNDIDFATDNNIILRAAGVDQVKLVDNIFQPVADSDVDLGTTGVRWKDAYVDSITVTGEIDGASLDIEGNADINGTTNLDAVDIDGAVDLAGELKLTGAFVPGAGINAQTDDTSIGLDLSEGNYFEVTLTNGQTPVATIDITNASLGQRFMVRVIQPSNGNIVLDSVADGWDAVQVNSGSRVATKWGGGVGPTLTTGNGSADLYGFVIRGLAGSAAIDGFIIGQDIKAT